MSISDPTAVQYHRARPEAEENGGVELVELSAVRLDGDSESDGEGLADAREDQKSLIAEEAEEIDENGVARDYEVALKHVGFGLFHVLLLLVNGVALLSDAIEVS